MEKLYQRAYFCAVFFTAVLVASPAEYFNADVRALQDLYKTLNQPQQLTGWKLDGGDPCDESWKGVCCIGSSVISLKLKGLNLSGYITPEIYNLYNLMQLDISSNSIGGEIPSVLPPRVTHMDLSYNNFTGDLPSSLGSLTSLPHLNLSHNLLSGTSGNVFTGLLNLREMDSSYNKFTGELPTSLGSLTSLCVQYLQHNFFSGTLKSLSELRLIDLNVESNLFTGNIPIMVCMTSYLRTGGNKFNRSNCHLDEKNLPLFPPTQSSPKSGEKRKGRLAMEVS